MQTSFESIEAFNADSRTVVGTGEPERLVGSSVAGGVFRPLGVLPRSAALTADVADETNGVVISDRLWRTKFAVIQMLGRTLTLDNATLSIVGVMPADFNFPRGTDYWRALRFGNTDPTTSRGNHYLQVMGGKPGVSFEQARSEMRTIGDQIAQQFQRNRLQERQRPEVAR